MDARRISEAVIRRMPKYYRQLLELKKQGVERISSGSLAELMRLNASQVRQDFNCFGGFGQQGYGYNVDTLLEEIKNILSINRHHSAVIVGAGNIGSALAGYDGFERDEISVRALFDVNDELIGSEKGGKPVYGMDKLEGFIRENDIAIGMIAARASVAQEIADRLVSAGIKGIWNFAPVDVTASVPVENIHMTDSLICLMYRMQNQ